MNKKHIIAIGVTLIAIAIISAVAINLLNAPSDPIQTVPTVEPVEVEASVGISPVNPDEFIPYENEVIPLPTVDDWTEELGEELDITEEEFPEFVAEVEAEVDAINNIPEEVLIETLAMVDLDLLPILSRN